MGTDKISKAIRESCSDDVAMQKLLIELLNFNLTGKSWYKDEYNRLIKKYALGWEDKDENKGD